MVKKVPECFTPAISLATQDVVRIKKGCLGKNNSQIGSREESASDPLRSKHPFLDHKYSFWQHHCHLPPLIFKPIYAQGIHSPVAITRPSAVVVLQVSTMLSWGARESRDNVLTQLA